MSRASWGKAVIALVLVMIMSFCIGIVLTRTDFAYAAGTGLAEWLISTEKNKTLSTEGERLGVIVEADGTAPTERSTRYSKGIRPSLSARPRRCWRTAAE